MASIPEDPRGEPGYQEFEDAEIGDYYVTRRLGRLPELAADCLRKLGKAGLHAKWRSKDDYMRRVRLKESGETFWLRFGRSVDHWRVPSVEVMRERQQQDAAILAALTLSEVGTTDIKRLDGEVLPESKNSSGLGHVPL